MQIHRYNKRTGYIDKTTTTHRIANIEYHHIRKAVESDPFCEWYRVTLVDEMRKVIVLDSDNPFYNPPR